MSDIKYAYLKGQTWLYRRNYPKDVALVSGSRALKQSLKTGDVKTARARAAEVNAKYEKLVRRVRSGVEEALGDTERTGGLATWGAQSKGALDALRSTLDTSGPISFPGKTKVLTVGDLSRSYLNLRGRELRWGGFKSVRYSVGLFTSKFSDRRVNALNRDDGREFLGLVTRLSPLIGKGPDTRHLSLDQLVCWSERRSDRITGRTRKRIWSQVNHFLDWVVYEGHLQQNPFRTVRFEGKIKPAPYAVPTDDEVLRLLKANDDLIHLPMLFCLLTGMRSGEAVGLLREDLVRKGNLGLFVHVRPNALRLLKTDAAERMVPLHSQLETLLADLPSEGPLFPEMTVNAVTKRFATLRKRLRLERPCLVFHSTRKWFITQCERTGVPEHFTASLVGHKSARSENGITYGIYSAGISDEQKRGIIDQIRLPPC